VARLQVDFLEIAEKRFKKYFLYLSTMKGTEIQYFFYAGSNAYNSLEILEKVQNKIEICRNEENFSSYFELNNLINYIL